MISFKDITLADKDTITSFTMKSDRRNCDLSFSNLCSWRFLYDTKFAVVDNFLVFKFWAGEQLAYMMPIGTGDLKAILRKLIEDADKEKQSFCMLGVCSNMRVDLETTLPSQFVFTEDRDYADYIYLKSDLSTLKGKIDFASANIRKKPFTAMAEMNDFRSAVKTGEISFFKWLIQAYKTDCHYYYNKKDSSPFWHLLLHTLLRKFRK